MTYGTTSLARFTVLCSLVIFGMQGSVDGRPYGSPLFMNFFGEDVSGSKNDDDGPNQDFESVDSDKDGFVNRAEFEQRKKEYNNKMESDQNSCCRTRSGSSS